MASFLNFHKNIHYKIDFVLLKCDEYVLSYKQYIKGEIITLRHLSVIFYYSSENFSLFVQQRLVRKLQF